MPLNIENNKFFDKYLTNLKNKYTRLSEEEKNKIINNIRDNANKVFQKISSKNNKSILLAGKIQSGKTSTFIGLICKIFESCFSNFVVILAGVNNELYNQNLYRIKDSFSENYFSKNILIFDKKLSNFSLDSEVDNSKKRIIVLLKNHQCISNFLRKLDNFSQDFIINPIIIDDEGDQYSFNNIKIYEKLNVNSATYQEIKNLFEKLHNSKLLTVTATPEAHIFSPKKYGMDDNILKPDSVVITKPNDGYIGLDFFVSGIEGLSITRTIDEEDVKSASNDGIITDSFREAIVYFFTYGLIYHYNYMNQDENPEMIINVNVKNEINFKIKENLNFYIVNNFLKNLTDEKTIEFKSLTTALHEYNNYCKNEYNEEEFKNKKITSDEIINKLKEEIDSRNFSIQTIVQNISKEKTNKMFNFYIGSLKINRGYTFDNLIISYALRRNKRIGQMDTILQMCRWFGYRDEYKFLIRLWTSETLQSDFSNTLEATEILFEKLEDFEAKGKTLKEFKKSMYINQDNYSKEKSLIATRESVISQQIINTFSFSKTSYIFKPELKYQKINKLIYDFRQEMIKEIKKRPFVLKDKFINVDNYPSVLFKNLREFKLAMGSLLSEKLNFAIFDESSNKFDIWKILEEKEKGCKGIVVSIMTQKNTQTIDNFSPRQREFKNYKIIGMEKGINPTYCGDRYWGKLYPDHIFCQIHSIIPTDGRYNKIQINTGFNDPIIFKLLFSLDENFLKIKNYYDNVFAKE